MANEDIKKMIRDKGLFHYQIAEALGLQDSGFSRLLRKELSDERKREIVAIMKRLKGVQEDEKK